MAFKRYTIDGYGQVELNNVAFRRDGRIEAQCGLDATDFASAPCENGMALIVDKVKKVVRFADENEVLPIALNYSTEHMYDERTTGLKNFKIDYRADGTYFFPRMGYLAVGDLFTTNCFGYDDATYTGDDKAKEAIAAVKTTPLYAVPGEAGAWELVTTAPTTGCVAEVVKPFTMPDGQFAIQLRVIRA